MITKILDKYTMYKVILVSLIVLVFSGYLLHSPLNYSLSIILFVSSAFLYHYFFSFLFKVVANHESWLISALILICIFDPPKSVFDVHMILLASFLTQLSKYIFVYRRSHIFNPVAISIFILTLFGVGNASWWVGNPNLLPLVLILGCLVIIKVRRQSLFWTFLAAATSFILIRQLPLSIYFISGPILFFACFMLTEPLTTPPTTKSQLLYATISGFFYTYYFHLGPIYGGAEFALIAANLFSFLYSPRQNLSLTLVSIKKVATNIYDFSFSSKFSPQFTPGQYFEWTLNYPHPDFRGNRRWFTLASSPTEKFLRLGVSIPARPSSFKKALLSLKPGDVINAHQPQGEFILPQNRSLKLAFIAGGIGVTPFRSMIKYLLDTQDRRDLVLIYAGANDTFAYRDIFDKVKTIYHNTKIMGRLNGELIKTSIPDFKDRQFYLSGPGVMVDNYTKVLRSLGVNHIHTDYFPGF